MIALRDVRVRFSTPGGTDVDSVGGVTLEIPEGQFATVIGGNGSGKSTLLNAIAGCVPLAEGEVQIDGQSVAGMAEHRRAKWMARVFQDPYRGTSPSLTVSENLHLASLRSKRHGLRRSLNRAERERQRESLAALGLGLEGRMDSPIGVLSGGQRQAITLLMAIIQTPKLILLDEPTAALDPATEEIVVGLIRRLVEAPGITTLMVTHSMRQALELGSRTLMLQRGVIVRDLGETERKALDAASLAALFESAV
jgi:putative ABC transport system ATP-binding protein